MFDEAVAAPGRTRRVEPGAVVGDGERQALRPLLDRHRRPRPRAVPHREIDEIVGSLAVARVPVAAAAEGMVLTL
jgi:hypothetical protein